MVKRKYLRHSGSAISTVAVVVAAAEVIRRLLVAPLEVEMAGVMVEMGKDRAALQIMDVVVAEVMVEEVAVMLLKGACLLVLVVMQDIMVLAAAVAAAVDPNKTSLAAVVIKAWYIFDGRRKMRNEW